MAVITLLNQKGGVGKSTTTFHLGGALAKVGQRVLLVDNDPQSSLTQGAIGPDLARDLAAESSLAAIYRRLPINPETLVIPLAFAGLELLPNTGYSTSFNHTDPHLRTHEEQASLTKMVRKLSPRYDIVLIDCPPNLYLATWAALAASDGLIIPVQPEDFGIQGLASVEGSINLVRATINPQLAMVGVLISMFGARKAIHLGYDALLRETYGDAVFTTRVPHAIDLPDATMHNTPLAWYKPRSAAAKAINAVASEVLTRLALAPSQSEVA